MKNRIFALGFVLVSAWGGAPAMAADAKGGYVILGPGAYRCERIIADLSRDAERHNPASVIVYSNWLAGALTRHNRETKGTYSILGPENFSDAFAWTVQYCREHPDSIYAAASDAVIAMLQPHRYAAMPHIRPPRREEKDDEEEEDDKDDDK